MSPNLNFGLPDLGSIGFYGMQPGAGQFSMGMPVPAPMPVQMPKIAPMPAVAAAAPAVAPSLAAGGAAAAAPGGFSLGSALKGLFWEPGKVGADGQMGSGQLNLDGLADLAGIASSLGSLWSGFQANSLAKDALRFQKDSYNTNLSNQLSSYNMSLEDRVRSRYAQEGRSSADAEQYIERNRLKA